jgi:predicted DNA-binding transcriptional regulator AlpA
MELKIKKLSPHQQFLSQESTESPDYPTHDPNRLLRLPDVLKLIPVSKSCWWSWVADNKAPPPVRLGRTTAWRYIDLLNFINQAVNIGGVK